MGRITIHVHGSPKEKAYNMMLENYQMRLKNRNIKVEYHSNKKSVDAFVADISKTGKLYLLDERGKQFSAISTDHISLSKLTLPHELAAVMLAEQVYRATEIIKGTKYHRD